jgi:hypothetical protein
MPPIRSQSSQNRVEQEGRILLAIQAIKNQEIASIQEVANRFNVPRTTLRRRLAGYTNRSETIKNSFAAAGLVPYDPDRVISKLDIHLRTPTPPSSRGSEWEPKTPSNYVQLQKQASSIKALLKQRLKSPPNPLNSAINQVLKACQITMQSLALLEKEVSKLRAENEKKKRKRTRSTRQNSREEGVLVSEALDLIQVEEPAIEAPIPRQLRPPPAPLQPRTRALPKCGACGIEGHKRNACPNRP